MHRSGCKPLFEAFGRRVYDVGAFGNGSHA